MLCTSALQCGSHQAHVAAERLSNWGTEYLIYFILGTTCS